MHRSTWGGGGGGGTPDPPRPGRGDGFSAAYGCAERRDRYVGIVSLSHSSCLHALPERL